MHTIFRDNINIYVLLDKTTVNFIVNRFFKCYPPAHVAQSVERVLGKDEVGGSNPLVGSTQ